MKKKLQINSLVVFDATGIPEKYRPNYEAIFPKGELYVYLGDIKQMKGYCILCDLDTGLIIGAYDKENFREATADECEIRSKV